MNSWVQCDACFTQPKEKSGRPSGGGAFWSVKLCVGTAVAHRRWREERAPRKSIGPLGVSWGQSGSRGRLQGQGSCAGDPPKGMQRGGQEESLLFCFNPDPRKWVSLSRVGFEATVPKAGRHAIACLSPWPALGTLVCPSPTPGVVAAGTLGGGQRRPRPSLVDPSPQRRSCRGEQESHVLIKPLRSH